MLFSFADLLIIGVIWISFDELYQLIIGIEQQATMIKFGNRTSFFIVSMVIPLVHLMGIIEYFQPDFIDKHRSVLNKSGIFLCVFLIIVGFAGSVWMKSQVENAGYVYCRKASGVSALAKTLVYTKNMDICEDLVASKRKNR